jgi:hypothetical protein
MKRVYLILLVPLLCSCTAHRESGEGADSERLPERLPFLDRANPLVKRTFESMEEHARDSKFREYLRAEGVRVCEEGEHGTRWKEDCRTCWCERGHRYCDNAVCPPSPEQLELERITRLKFEKIAKEEEKQHKEWREMHRAAGRRVCEEGEHGGLWEEDCNSCFCNWGVRTCTQLVCQKSVQSKREKIKP